MQSSTISPLQKHHSTDGLPTSPTDNQQALVLTPLVTTEFSTMVTH